MNVPQMREWLKSSYGYGKSWCYKVDKMPDDQVVAVFNRMSSQGKKK